MVRVRGAGELPRDATGAGEPPRDATDELRLLVSGGPTEAERPLTCGGPGAAFRRVGVEGREFDRAVEGFVFVEICVVEVGVEGLEFCGVCGFATGVVVVIVLDLEGVDGLEERAPGVDGLDVGGEGLAEGGGKDEREPGVDGLEIDVTDCELVLRIEAEDLLAEKDV